LIKLGDKFKEGFIDLMLEAYARASTAPTLAKPSVAPATGFDKPLVLHVAEISSATCLC
jgi:hypothetical protein